MTSQVQLFLPYRSILWIFTLKFRLLTWSVFICLRPDPWVEGSNSSFNLRSFCLSFVLEYHKPQLGRIPAMSYFLLNIAFRTSLSPWSNWNWGFEASSSNSPSFFYFFYRKGSSLLFSGTRARSAVFLHQSNSGRESWRIPLVFFSWSSRISYTKRSSKNFYSMHYTHLIFWFYP